MGLDMYLLKRPKFHQVTGRADEVQEIAYWRKFNTLHFWFVQNIQNSVDECEQSRPILKSECEKLLLLLKSINKQNCQNIFSIKPEFFFGYAEEDIKSTILKLSDIINNFDFNNNDLVYQSSW